MGITIHHSASVSGSESFDSGLAGSPKVPAHVNVQYQAHTNFFKWWPRDIELTAFATEVLDLKALGFGSIPELRDLYTDQSLNLIRLQTDGEFNSTVTVTLKRGSDTIATVPLSHKSHFQLFEEDIPVFGAHVDTVELLAINGNCKVSIVLATLQHFG